MKYFRRQLSLTFQYLQGTALYRRLRQTSCFERYFIPLIEKSGIIKREIDFNTIAKLVTADRPIIFEIGSDSGSDTARFCKMFPRGIIYSFEPDPRNIVKFKQRTDVLSNVIFVEKAVSNINGSAPFHLSYGRNGQGSSSLREPGRTLSTFPEITFPKVINVDCITLDKFVEENQIKFIDFVWMDVQGAEDLVFSGGIQTFRSKVRFIYTEYSNVEMYRGQANLNKLLDMLEVYRVENVFTSNILLRNILM